MSAERILIIRTSALGDVVHALPVLTSLRRQRPQAQIGWVVESAMAPLLEGHPDLDELLIVALRRWRRSLTAAATWRELGRFLVTLHRFSPTVVLDLMGNHKAGLIGALTMADRRVGLARGERREPSSAVWISEPVAARGPHAVERALSTLDALGLAAEAADFGGDKLFARQAAAAPAAAEEGRFAVICPGAGWANKIYPPERWGRVAALLAEETGLAVRVAPGRGEEGLAAAVEAASGGAATALPVTNLAELADLLRRSSLALGGDTGPIHLGHALGVPVLCLMGPTDPERNGPYAAPEKALWHRLPCSFCHQRLDESKACLLEISPQRVAERAAALARAPC